MPVDFSGKTIYQPNDIGSAARRRLGILDSFGTSQNQFAEEKATRDKSARQAAIALRLQNAQTEAVNQGTRNNTAISNFAAANMPGETTIPSSTGKAGGRPAGATNSSTGFTAFKRAVSGKESGNNYGAQNPYSGAMGKYQIMPSNIAGSGGWDKTALGYNVTNDQFMKSPQIQEKIANYYLQSYYDKYGPAGAAVAWYAGPNAAKKYVASGSASTRGEAGGHPSVSSYIQDILNRMGL